MLQCSMWINPDLPAYLLFRGLDIRKFLDGIYVSEKGILAK